MTAARSLLIAGWRLLVWLVPISFLAPIGAVTWALVQAAPSAGNAFTQISIFFELLAIGALALFFFASVVAGGFAIKGRPSVGLVVLGVVSAFFLPPAFFPGALRTPLIWLIALPGAVAFVVALLGLLQLRRADRPLAVAVGILLALPVVSLGGFRAYFAVYYARDCPAGPVVDLTISGTESAHFSRACGLPLSGSELTGCRNGGDATVGLLSADGPWFLELSAYGQGTVTSEKSPIAAPRLLVNFNQSYGGPYGWQGYYSVYGPCVGYIDADLYGAVTGGTGGQTDRGPGPPVHVKGRWETPLA
jgi:hypothetical protein